MPRLPAAPPRPLTPALRGVPPTLRAAGGDDREEAGSSGIAPALKVQHVAAIVAGVATLVALAGALLVYWREAHTPHVTAATLRAESGLSVWTVEVDGQHLTVHGARLRPRPIGYSYVLWAWPRHGKPVSLGRLPAGGTARLDLDPAQSQALARARQVAVSVEARGSPLTGRRVILKAPLQVVSESAVSSSTS